MSDSTAPPSTDPDGEGRSDAETRKDLSRKAVGSFLWSATSFGSSKLIMFLMTVLLARLLTPSDFGLVAAGLSVAAFLEIALDFGVGSALIYEQEKGITHRVRVAFTLSLIIAAVLTLLGIAASPLVATFFKVPDATMMFRVLFCYLMLRGIGQVQDALLQRDLRYQTRTIIDILRALGRGIASVALAFAGEGAWAIIIGTVAGEAVAATAYCSLVRVRPTVRLPRAVVWSLLKFGLPLLSLNIVNTVSAEGDKMIVGGRLNPGALGMYTIAQKLPEMVIDNVYWVFQKIAYGIYARARTGGMPMFRSAMLRALRLITLFGFPMGTALAVIAPIAVPLLFSEAWEPAVPAMVIISVTAGLGAIGYASGDLFPAIGRPAALLKATTTIVLVMLVAMWFIAPLGIEAIALLHLAFQIFWGPVRLHVANRLVGTTWMQCIRAMAPGILASLGIVVVALPVSMSVGHDVLGLLATIVAGVLGAGGAVALFSRGTFAEVIELVRNRDRE